MKAIILCLAFLVISIITQAQVAINTSGAGPATSSMLDVASTIQEQQKIIKNQNDKIASLESKINEIRAALKIK